MKITFAAILLSLPSLAFAQSAEVTGAYAFQPNPAAKNGAIFFRINNTSDAPLHLVNVETGAAHMAQLHSNDMNNGVMKMLHLEDGLEIPAGGCALLERGGYHIMLMGLNENLEAGQSVPLTLNFADGESLSVEVPVEQSHEPSADDANCIRADAAKMMGTAK